jgi:hypothetical protein
MCSSAKTASHRADEHRHADAKEAKAITHYARKNRSVAQDGAIWLQQIGAGTRLRYPLMLSP